MSSRTITGSTTLVATDAGLEIRYNSSSAGTVTIPASVFAVNDTVTIRRVGTGNVTVEAASGVTLNGVSQGTATTAKSYQLFYIEQTATDEWTLEGNVTDTATSDFDSELDGALSSTTDPDLDDSYDFGTGVVTTNNPTASLSTDFSNVADPDLDDSYDFDVTDAIANNSKASSSDFVPVVVNPKITPVIIIG